MMPESLLIAAAKKIIAVRLAEFAHMITDEYNRILQEKEHGGDESTIAAVTEIANHDDLGDTGNFSKVVLLKQPFGFGLAATEYKDGKHYTTINGARN